MMLHQNKLECFTLKSFFFKLALFHAKWPYLFISLFYDWLTALLENIWLGWKTLPWTNTSAYFALARVTINKSFKRLINIICSGLLVKLHIDSKKILVKSFFQYLWTFMATHRFLSMFQKKTVISEFSGMLQNV
jgi:hypothetical protein